MQLGELSMSYLIEQTKWSFKVKLCLKFYYVPTHRLTWSKRKSEPEMHLAKKSSVVATMLQNFQSVQVKKAGLFDTHKNNVANIETVQINEIPFAVGNNFLHKIA